MRKKPQQRHKLRRDATLRKRNKKHEKVKVKVRRKMDVSKLCDGIFQSGRLSNSLPGIDVILSLQREFCDTPFLQHVKMFVWMPMADIATARPSIKTLDMFADMIIGWRRLGWNVLTHCAAGISRSTMVNMAYFMKAQHLTVGEALAKISAIRPQVAPNEGFMYSLREYDAYLRSTW